jgi:hypothetical protein
MNPLPGLSFVVHQTVVGRRPVGSPGEYTEQPEWAQTSGPPSESWVLKLARRGLGRSIPAEAFTWLVGREIGVPLPDAALYAGEDGRGFLSRRIPDARNWAPEDRDAVSNPREIGAMLALDAVLANGDRHQQNVLVVGMAKGDRRLIAIDHGRSDIVHEARLMALGEAPPRPHPDRPDLDYRALRPAALAAAGALSALSEDTVTAWLSEAFLAQGEAVPAILPDLVLGRFNVAVRTVETYLDALGVDR